MGRAVKNPPNRKGAAIAASPGKLTKGQLNLTALQQTPGFMVRILQLHIFEEFFAYFADTGFSPAEHSVLVTVRDNPSVTQSELAAVLRIQLPNLVKILTKLEAAGFLRRKRSTKDKRAVELTLTVSGREAAELASKMARAFNVQTLSALSKREQTLFLDMLTRLVKFRTNSEGHDRPE
jgi:DNA-binding MarR family transcriptional regulator